MNNLCKAANGHAARKSGQETGLENELKMLSCIMAQKWVRENELQLITGMSKYTVGQVSRRLAERNQISRAREFGNAGYFLRLLPAGAERIGEKLGKGVTIPKSWKHDAMAIQTLHFLAGKHNAKFETEASVRRRTKSGKFPDGRLVADNQVYYFEQERARKSGGNLRKQTEAIAMLADSGTVCFIGYPYPARVCGGIDHETRLTNSLRHRWGSPGAPNIKLVRCHFDSLVACQNMQVGRFEIIDLPKMVNTVDSRKDRPGVTDQVKGFRWIMTEHNQYDEINHHIDAILMFNDKVCLEGVFTESDSWGGCHTLDTSFGIEGKGYAEEMTFLEFVNEQQKIVEKNVQGEMAMWAMQAKALAKEKEQHEQASDQS